MQCRLFQLTKPLVAAFPGCNAARAPLRRAACSAAAGDAASGGTGSPAPSQQFSLLRIAGDGNCLFRSLAQGGHVAAQEDAAAAGSGCLAPQLLSAEQETAAAGELRAAICQELLNRRWVASLSLSLDHWLCCCAVLPWLCCPKHSCPAPLPSPSCALAGRSSASSLMATMPAMSPACGSHTFGEVRLAAAAAAVGRLWLGLGLRLHCRCCACLPTHLHFGVQYTAQSPLTASRRAGAGGGDTRAAPTHHRLHAAPHRPAADQLLR